MTRTLFCVALVATILCCPTVANAASRDATLTSELMRTGFLLTVVAVAPAIFVCLTSFLRFAIVLAMIRHAFSMPETPPNIVLVSLAAFLTLFVMAPTFTEINSTAVQPLMAGEIGVDAALDRGATPLRAFMLRQTRDEDIASIYAISGDPLPDDPGEVDIVKLAPAFILNELRVSFAIGFVILLPFLLIEIVVASILLALGMMMTPPTTISLPLKLLLFVLIDGWSLVIQGTAASFR